MNNRKTITVCSILALIILAVVIFVTIISDLIGFSLILGALFIILTICLGIYLREAPDEYTAYIKAKRRILKTYDSIIVEVEDIPNIAGKNIIKVKTIEDLVDAQLELREPIYYKNDNDSCFFILLHYNEACIYILRMNEDVISPTEQSIRYMKEDPENKTEDLLDNLENTIVYKLDELRSFKISPVRNAQKIEIVDDTAIKEEIESNKDTNITKEVLEDEISKTMYIKDLKEKIKQYEEDQDNDFEQSTEPSVSNDIIKEENSCLDEISKLEETAEDVLTEQLKALSSQEKDIIASQPTSIEPSPAKVKKTPSSSKKSSSSSSAKPKKKPTPKKKAPVKENHQSRRATKYASKSKK